MNTLKKQYRDLETKVLNKLRTAINKSKTKSKHITGVKCLPVNLFDYTELLILDDRHTFIDKNGLHYNLFTDATLEDLIDILTQNKANNYKEPWYIQAENDIRNETKNFDLDYETQGKFTASYVEFRGGMQQYVLFRSLKAFGKYKHHYKNTVGTIDETKPIKVGKYLAFLIEFDEL